MKQQNTKKKPRKSGARSAGADVAPGPQISAVLARIEAVRSSLGQVGQRIADFIVKNPQEVVNKIGRAHV